MFFGRKQSPEEALLEKEWEYQISDRVMQADAVVQQMRREFGPETYIVKDEVLDSILFHLAFDSELDDKGNVKIKNHKNAFMAGLYFIHSSISQTSWIDRYYAEYLIALIRKEIYKEKIRIKLERNADLLTKNRMYSFLDLLEAYFTMVIASTIEGRRVSTLKVQPHIVKTEIRRGKEKGKRGGGLW